ncbi:MAG: hybrid sensor histidine kinase/response regulator [Desulfobacula sp.]
MTKNIKRTYEYADAENLEDLQILVVEDSDSARERIVSSLKELQVGIWEADDGVTALEKIRQNPDKIDLVISDLHMVQMDGDELCRKIRTELMMTALPVIILSADIDKKTTIDLFKAGATDYLYKPFIHEELVARIHVHLKQEKMKKVLKKNVIELQALDKMKNDFLAVCSHDLKSPLSCIVGFADILTREIENPDHIEMLKDILSSGEDLLSLINDILDLSRAEAERQEMEMDPIEPAKIISGCIHLLESAASLKHISLSMVDKAGETQIMGNASALSRIFNNLITNAIKFTPEKGQISITVKISDDNTLTVSVMDNGIGIPENKINELFTRYSRLSRKGTAGEKSTGLGLAIAKELAQHHRGTISVKSREGKGSIFKVSFPIHRLSLVKEALPASQRR